MTLGFTGSRPGPEIDNLRLVEGRVYKGTVSLWGVPFHVFFVEVEDRDGEQVAVDDPHDRLADFAHVEPNRVMTVTPPGLTGDYVAILSPYGV